MYPWLSPSIDHSNYDNNIKYIGEITNNISYRNHHPKPFTGTFFLMNRDSWYHGSHIEIDTTNYSSLTLSHILNAGSPETYMRFTYNTDSTREYKETSIINGTYDISQVKEVQFQSFSTQGWQFSIILQ